MCSFSLTYHIVCSLTYGMNVDKHMYTYMHMCSALNNCVFHMHDFLYQCATYVISMFRE